MGFTNRRLGEFMKTWRDRAYEAGFNIVGHRIFLHGYDITEKVVRLDLLAQDAGVALLQRKQSLSPFLQQQPFQSHEGDRA